MYYTWLQKDNDDAMILFFAAAKLLQCSSMLHKVSPSKKKKISP
jgi:hypothetical protein